MYEDRNKAEIDSMLRIILIIGVLASLDIYAFQAFRVSASDWQKSYKCIVYSAYWFVSLGLLSILLLEGMMDIFDVMPKSWRSYLIALFLVSFLSKAFMGSWLLIDDLRRITGAVWNALASGGDAYDRSRSEFLSKGAVLFGMLPLVVLTYGILRNAFRYKFFRHRLKFGDLSSRLEGLKIIQISDIHSGSFWKDEPISRVVDKINAENPDLILFTGDLVNSETSEIEPYIPIFSRLSAKYGVFSVLGNHDYGDYRHWESAAAKRKNMEDMVEAHRRLGWKLLRNEHVVLKVEGESVNIIGVDNYSAKPEFPKYGDLDKASVGLNPSELSILLSHDPTHWDDQVVTRHKYINLTLSGHTHGMQFGIEIPGYFKWSPAKYIYPRWAGLYREAEQYLYVNRGFGFLGYPGRVGILPEITVLELERKV